MRCTVVFHASLIPLSISRSSTSPVKFDIMQCYKTLRRNYQMCLFTNKTANFLSRM